MGIDMRRNIDPPAECIRYLTQKYCADPVPDSVILESCRSCAESYRIPLQKIEDLTAPLLPLEQELDAVMLKNRVLWDEMFYPGSEDENMLAWGLYMLSRQAELDVLSAEQLRVRLLAFLLTVEVTNLEGIRDMAELTRFLSSLSCSVRTKWVCLQVWQDPLAYVQKYHRMEALSEEVFAAHQGALQPLADHALDWLSSRLEADSGLIWSELEMEQGTEDVVVGPLCLEFNALGLVWDDTRPDGPACQFVGVLRPQVQALRGAYSNPVEQISDQLKIMADKSRLEILMALRAAPLCGQELCRQVGLSAGTVSHHMGSLVREGFVSMTKRGNRVTYELRRGKLEEFLNNLRAALI